jgi:hypothetical protein
MSFNDCDANNHLFELPKRDQIMKKSPMAMSIGRRAILLSI